MGILSNRQSPGDYDTDMKLAKSIGIDAFALNIGKDPQLRYAYDSAQANGMKVFILFDCAYFRQGDEYAIGGKIAQYASHPAQLRVGNNLVFVSTFVGDGLNVGAIRSSARNPIYFAPNFHPGMGSFGGLDGAFSCAAWPSNGRNKAPTGPGNTVSVDSFDRSYISALGGSIARREVGDGDSSAGGNSNRSQYVGDSGALGVVDASLNWIPDIMAAGEDSNSTVAAADAGGKGYIARGCPSVFSMTVCKPSLTMNADSYLPLVLLHSSKSSPRTTTENHTISDLSSKHTDDGASKWVNNMPHLGWAYLSKPFIAAYKASSPSVNPYITSDQIIYWYRIIPKSLNCDSTDTTMGNGNSASGDFFRGRPNGYQTLADNVFVVSFLTSPGTVTVNSGGTIYAFNAPQGASAFSVPFRVGSQRFALVRNGREVMGATSLKVIQNTFPCGLYNYNAYVGMVPDVAGRDTLQPGVAYDNFGLRGCAPEPSLPGMPPATTAPTGSTVIARAVATSPPV
ncbi:hypothetical protein V5O48_009673 [Marasmius crinis-equi]|uniref:Uncharacterized protein n=1 Tax=Marasmius crinis-equi TaxID=585013 RepID=A0ABR3FB18_9AGAR